MNFESKKKELFPKAGEIAHEFGAEAAVMIISSDDNNIYTLTTSDFLKKLVKCTETENRPAFHQFRPEGDDVLVPVEIGFLGDIARSLCETQMRMLDVSIRVMDYDELVEVEQQLKDRLTIIEKRKDLLPSTSTAATNRDPRPASIVGPQVNESLPSTSTSATTNRDPRPASFNESLPSTSTSATTNRDPRPESIVGPQVNESLPSTSTSAVATVATDNSQHNRDNHPLRDLRVELVEAIFLIVLSWTAVYMSISQQLS